MVSTWFKPWKRVINRLGSSQAGDKTYFKASTSSIILATFLPANLRRQAASQSEEHFEPNESNEAHTHTNEGNMSEAFHPLDLCCHLSLSQVQDLDFKTHPRSPAAPKAPQLKQIIEILCDYNQQGSWNWPAHIP